MAYEVGISHLFGYMVGLTSARELMSERSVIFTANSTATLSSTSPSTRNELMSALNNLNENSENTIRITETGDYVTLIGPARIVWRPQHQNILVLTVFSPSA
jgi:hypothetical protein